MAKKTYKINICDYGIVRERSEGQLYLMRKSLTSPAMAEEVAAKLDCGWVKTPDNESKYRVLRGDVSWAKKADKPALEKILKEAEKNRLRSK